MGAGGTLGKFFEGIQGTLGSALEKKHEEEQSRKKELRDFYLKGILNADTDEQAKHAADEYAKLSGPEAKKGFQRIAPLLQKLRGARGQQQQQGGPAAAPQMGRDPGMSASGSKGIPMDEKLPSGQDAMLAGTGIKTPSPRQTFNAGPQSQFDTQLTPEEEQQFQQWKAKYAPKDSGMDYDLRGAFKAGLTPDPQTGHWPDTFKKPNHPTFSDQSKYAKDAPDKAGHWEGDKYVPPKQAASPQRAQFDKGPNLTGIYSTSGQKADLAEERKMRYATQEYDFWLKKGKEVLGKDASPRDLAEYAGSKGTKLPPLVKAVSEKAVARPGEDPATGKPYEGLWDHHTDPSGEETWAKRPDVVKGGGSIRSVPHSVSLQDAKKQAESGAVFKDGEGKELDLDKLPPDMGLQAMVVGDKMFWIPITPNQKTTTVGNVVYATTPYNVTQVGQPAQEGGPVALGQQRTGSTNTPTQVVQGPNGPVALGSTTVPNSPGARPAAAPRPSSGGPAGTATPSRPAAAPAVAGTGGGSPRPLVGAPLSSYNTQSKAIGPVRVALSQLFGDPKNPEFKPYLSYADLADDPGARERIGTAFNLVMDGISASPGGTVSAGAGGVGVNAGGLVSLLENWADVPKSLAKSKQEQYAKVFQSMSPREREALAMQFSALSTIIGVRQLTGASSAQFSTSALERDVPQIGNTGVDSGTFYTKMAALAEDIKNGTKGKFSAVFEPGELERINQLPTEMQRLKKGPAKAPAAKGGSGSVVDKLVDKYK